MFDKTGKVFLCLVIIFLPSVSIPDGGLKIDENKLKGYDALSVQSGTGRLSCSSVILLLLCLFQALQLQRNFESYNIVVYIIQILLSS